eukprot:15442141-Alexandrium_andersonii.AAC.1
MPLPGGASTKRPRKDDGRVGNEPAAVSKSKKQRMNRNKTMQALKDKLATLRRAGGGSAVATGGEIT